MATNWPLLVCLFVCLNVHPFSVCCDASFRIVVIYLQACRSCVKKISGAIQTSGQVTSVENIMQLDKMADEVLRSSPR